MAFEEIRAVWLVLRREYVERVKSFSFLASTFAAPLLFLAASATPALFATPHPVAPKNVVIAGAAPQEARQIAEMFQSFGRYRVTLATNTTPEEHAELTAMVRNSQIEGFVWLDAPAIASGRVVYTSRSGLDADGRDRLRRIIYLALLRTRLAARGLAPSEIERALQPVTFSVVALRGKGSGKSEGDPIAVIVVTVTLITILEMSLLSYGIIVMRSVLEDKTSRMVEILLCSVTPRALMAGKVLGIGGLSFTQAVIWGAMAAGGVTMASRIPATGVASGFTLGPGSLAVFTLFYVLGYLLYSSLYAALGAAFNSADDAQYWSFVLTLPLLFAGMAAWSLFEQADSAIAVALSLVPPLAPVMMSMRIATGAAPGWQIAISAVLMIAAIYAAWVLSARIYRVGTLMFGKKPSLREISRWVRYA